MIFNKVAREQSGSDSYNRYEFQTSYTFNKLLAIYKEENKEKTIFCELHDDLIISNDSIKFNEVNFFQVKTRDSGTFTYNRLFKVEPGKKHSFMGYVFYNFLNFPNICKKCYFITNQEINSELNSELDDWIKSVHYKTDLKMTHPTSYNNIKSSIKNEFPLSICPDNLFEKTFNIFIKNTYFELTDLDLKNHRKIVHSNFVQMMEFKNLQLDTVQHLHEAIRREIVEKSTTKFDYIASRETILNKKSISYEIFDKIQSSLIKKNEVSELFSHLPLNIIDIKIIKKALKQHNDYMILNPDDIEYFEEIEEYLGIYETYFTEQFFNISSTSLPSEFNNLVSGYTIQHQNINLRILEGLFYEKYFEKISEY
ncbi:dsDNA nuclease domain-containing protein [Lysinibacillus xylanilyticus]|uniref:DsDNA nuclease domain-containing protein n=1 Tax=Lysinibacillus xylanilyticus TaxID=582475 RepID=A0ABV3VQ90_9BACI